MSSFIRAIAAYAAAVAICAATICAATLCTATWALAGPFSINIIPGPGLAGNAAALASFQRAADDWSAQFTNPMTVNIDADLGTLGPTVLGETSVVYLQDDYSTGLLPQFQSTVISSPGRSIVNSLPATISTANVRLPAATAGLPNGFGVDSNVFFSKANAKALGYDAQVPLDATFGASDGTITFSNAFPFDYDRTTITLGNYDFQTVAAHEIGHVLGFNSNLDTVDYYLSNPPPGLTTPLPVQLSILDLFRFANTPGLVPTTAAEFNSFPRSLIPGEDEVTSDSISSFRMATGVYNGDGNQGSHWKNDDFTGQFIGLMDPTLAANTVEDITPADLQALNLIGYNLAVTPVPEPGSMTLLLSGSTTLALAAAWRRRRQRATLCAA